MSIQTFLTSALKQSFPIFGDEEITIGQTKVKAIIGAVEWSNALGRASTNTERSIQAQFLASAYTGDLRTGTFVTARAESWQISGEPGAVSKDGASIVIRLVEPERRAE